MKRAIFVLGLLCFNFAFAQNMIEFSNYINNQEIKKVKNFHYLRKNKFDNKQYFLQSVQFHQNLTNNPIH